MTRRQATVAAVVAALVMVGGIAGALTGRAGSKSTRAAGNSALASNKSFNTAGLPPVHTDPCPRGADLLPVPVTGKDALPDLTLECIGAIASSDTVSLRRLGGVPMVVNLWASWCIPCRQEMPDLQRVYAAAGGRVRFIAINTKDTAESARATILGTEVRYPSLADPAAKVRAEIGANYMPTTLFVSAEGRIVFRKAGQFPDAAAIRAAIAEHLGVTL